ncbi:hypothetical protein Ciccas_012370, partial [Cichlidogyrus casuarinus]
NIRDVGDDDDGAVGGDRGDHHEPGESWGQVPASTEANSSDAHREQTRPVPCHSCGHSTGHANSQD